ncbi:MAG: diol dehydratase reactivase ATPase-like domain-containing protein [Candidatus Nanopelagicales bacterium]
MSLVAGVDIGNATTEIVIADTGFDPPKPIVWDRGATKGPKGSTEAALRAARMLTRLERRLGATCDQAVLTPQSPVLTHRIDLPAAVIDTGSLTLVAIGSPTPAGMGVGVGHPVDIAAPPSSASADNGALVLVARDPLGYRATVMQVPRWLAAGHVIAGLVLAGDEARLVGSRLSDVIPGVPIIDSVDAELAFRCDLIAIEVAAPGQHVRALGDPIWLADALLAGTDAHDHSRAMTSVTRGHRSAAIGRFRDGRPPLGAAPAAPIMRWADGTVTGFDEARSRLRILPVGSVDGFTVPPSGEVAVDDLWVVGLDAIEAMPGLRSGSVRDLRLVMAALATMPPNGDSASAFTEAWHGPVALRSSEAQAARLGALTTPGARTDALIVDLGGGTIDVVPSHGSAITAAGSGDLLTEAVAHALSISSGAAEWAKRGPASRIESPQLVTDESGDRRFLDTPAPHGAVGWLVVPGPSGPLPFSRELSVAEWRLIRLTLKQMVLADNLRRVRAHLGEGAEPSDVIVVGGPAGDDEILEILRGNEPASAFGRANVAGALGHRWAVAYGLVLASPDPGFA